MPGGIVQMNELIPINYDSDVPTVSGRDLHAALEVDTRYDIWFSRMCEYGFSEIKDYILVDQFCTTNNPKNPSTTRTNHAVSITMAKELCMLQRSAKGKEFREYFIRCEEAWNSPEKIIERALQIARAKVLELEHKNKGLEEHNETLEIALNESSRFYTVAKYSSYCNKYWSLRQCQYIGKLLTAFCRSRHIEIRRCYTNDERFGVVNSYPLTAWEAFWEAYRRGEIR
jgi:phage anti-repressor protein